jgi:hypothetical protein
MRKKSHKRNRKAGTATLVQGILVGGVVGATLGWLTAPAAGAETRRRLRGKAISARERAKTATGNVESRVRELVEEVREQGNPSTIQHKRTAGVRS